MQRPIVEIFPIIKQVVMDLEIEFKENKGLILTEDDLKCHLFRKLYPLFGESEVTLEPAIKASPLHSELYFFNGNGILSKKPDLAIIQPKNLSIYHSVELNFDSTGIRYKEMCGKEYSFCGTSIIFELKFCKSKNGITSRHIETYKKDIEKIQELQTIANTNQVGNKIIGIFIVFNKTNKKTMAFNELLQYEDETLRILYGTGNVEFHKDVNEFF